MKWFQHNTDSHTNLKHRELLTDFGLEGYAVYWICLELVGQQGEKYRLNGSKSWQKALKDITKLPQEKLDKFLSRFGELNLICHKSLKKGDLYIPKMREYSDDYTKKLRRVSEQCSLRIDKITIDKIILQYITLKNYKIQNEDGTKNKELEQAIWQRNVRPTKRLLFITKGQPEKIIKCMQWFSKICDSKNLTWTLETIEKWLPEYLAKGESIDQEALRKEFGLK